MLVAAASYKIHSVSDSLIEEITRKYNVAFEKSGATQTNPPAFYTVFHVEEYRDVDYVMELWKRVEEIKENTENITYYEISESKVAYLGVTEDYNHLEQHYHALFNFIKENHWILNGFPRETYIMDAASDIGYVTEIQIPFKK